MRTPTPHTPPGPALRRLALAACALLALLALGPARAAAQGREPDLPAYTALVREAAIAARRGDRLALEEAAGRLAAVEAVLLPGGERVAVDNRWLADELAAPAPDTVAIAARLGALADALSLPPGAAPADARERLRELLGRPPFDRSDVPPSWWEEFWRWVARLIEQLVRPVGSVPTGAAEPAAYVIAAVGGLLLLGVIAYLLLGLRRSLVSGASARAADPEAHLSGRDAFEQAAQLAQAGDSRTAVRYLYLAALLWLDERRLLRYDRALTNREYLERAREHPQLQQRLAPIITTFDRVWYGHAALSADELAEYRAQVERLRDGATG